LKVGDGGDPDRISIAKNHTKKPRAFQEVSEGYLEF
jgi:hypothetical protein